MTVLSNSKIVAAIKTGRIRIDPEPLPLPGEAGTPYATTAVDLRLSPTIQVPKENLTLAFDLREGSIKDAIEAVCVTQEIPETGWSLRPNHFILGTTIETVELPRLKDGLAARVEGRSSYARTGLLVHFTAPTIHAGFKGKITLEIMNLGPLALTLFPGLRICQLIFETVDGSPTRSDSQFHGQTRPSGASAGAKSADRAARRQRKRTRRGR